MKTITFTIIRIEHKRIQVPADIPKEHRMESARKQYGQSACKFDERYVRCIEGDDRIDFEKILDGNINWEPLDDEA